MRCAIIAVLVAIPAMIVTWVISRGIYAQPPGSDVAFLVDGASPTAEESPTAEAPPTAEVPPTVEASAPAEASPSATPVESANPDGVLKALFSTPLAGAKVDGELELYDGDGLFDYIDGAAPIFIERGFRRLAAAEMKTGTDGELTCDVYDMQVADNAAAIFDKEQPPTSKTIDIGDAARTSAMALVFRKGRYYVKLTAFDGPGEEALPAIARALSEAMP